MASLLITPSQLSLFSISPVIGAWWEELQAQKLLKGSKPALRELFNKGHKQTGPGKCTNCISWRKACQGNEGQLYPGQDLVFKAVEHSCRSVHASEEMDRIGRRDALLGSSYAIASGNANTVAEAEPINRLCRISSYSQRGGVH